MGPEESSIVSQTLCDICDRNYLDNVAIQYHDLDRFLSITYAEVYAAKEMILDFLKCLKSFEFVGINSDIPEYCVPSLMLGILSSGNGFVNMPIELELCESLIGSLSMRYLFTGHVTYDGEVLHHFTIHNEYLYLIRLKNVKKHEVQSRQEINYAYAITTSGSTGVPKVVRVPHSCIVPNILDMKRIFVVSKSDRIAQLTNLTFDPSIVNIFLALSSSGMLFMASKSLRNNAGRLLDKVYSSQITILQMTPSVFLYSWSTEHLKSTILSKTSPLRALILGGEPFPKLDLVFSLKHTQNDTKIYDIYGITEVSCWSSINEVVKTDAEKVHYLGNVLSQTMFQVRNETGEVISKGEGVLYIGSNTRVCVIDNEATEVLERPVFRYSGDIVDVAEDGRIFYSGRNDRIVKRFGNKLDLTKLEKTVLELNFIKNCYVVWDEKEHKLHACLSATKGVAEYPNMKTDIMKHLCKLQSFYKPDRIHFLEYFEFTSNGKICMNFLRKLCRGERIVANDLENVEAIVRSTWKDYLKYESGDFVKLGGTSVTALQMSNAFSEAFNTEFPELISILLKDASFKMCLAYVKDTVANNYEKKIIRSSEPDSNNVEGIFPVTVDSDQKVWNNSGTLSSGRNIYQWHKCRGQTYGNISIKDPTLNLKSTRITSVDVLHTCNLEKCVDASPTVFQYLDGNPFASVGSHSGFICTVELGDNCNSEYKVKLPDRIEASVLVLDEFRGIVGCYDGCVYCVELKTGEIIWKHKTADIVKCTAISCEKKGRIFVGSYDCHVYCLSVEDGSEIWKTKAGSGGITASGCLHPQSDSVLFGTLDGSCLALQQSSGKVTWKHTLGDPIFVAPLILNCGLALFCTVAGTLSCFDIEVNMKMWRYTINGNVFSYIVVRSDPLTSHETIVLSSQNKTVYCLESGDDFKTEPSLKHVLNFHSPIFPTPWCEGDSLFVMCTDGVLNIYSFLRKKSVKTVKLPGDVFSSPVVSNNLVIVGCRDNNVYILRMS